MFLYVDKMEEFTEVSEVLICYNFNLCMFIYLKMYYVPFDYNSH